MTRRERMGFSTYSPLPAELRNLLLSPSPIYSIISPANKEPAPTSKSHPFQTHILFHPSQTTRMPSVIVTFKDTALDADYEKAKNDLLAQGGKITRNFEPLMKGFAAEIPDGFNLQSINSFAGDNILSIEEDGKVTTQA
ncbi:hypothetical protein D9756_005265 [Leucocoprinus leucothites]|uniref:Inhibitor I9 domain-containing protein n=1 Tax=Leucocoprinus leucothites TaxID=201217 RepID=A0A8H5D9B5_9AGAR|nr:hypothetical protein D9756_005265 [Leucoagaricus leucothites]